MCQQLRRTYGETVGASGNLLVATCVSLCGQVRQLQNGMQKFIGNGVEIRHIAFLANHHTGTLVSVGNSGGANVVSALTKSITNA